MNEDYIYDSTILNATSHKIASLISNHLLPEVATLLDGANNEAVPTMAMKLLAVLFEINDGFVRKCH